MADEIDIPEEPEDAGDHDVPADLVELHEVLEWANATQAGPEEVEGA